MPSLRAGRPSSGRSSYAGTLTISVIGDPDLTPELDDIARALRRELEEGPLDGGPTTH